VTTTELRQADHPVLVDRSDALDILGVSETTFTRLCREGRFENRVCAGPPRELYMASELRRYRAQGKRLGASAKGVTNAAGEPSKSADLGVTSETEIDAGAGKRPGMTNDTWAICEGCQKPFRPRRAGMRVCSPACRQRMARQRRQLA
jgi:hypothetical protein